MNKAVLVAMIILIAVGGCSIIRPHPPVTTNFTGVWKMDRELSGRPSTLPGLSDFKPEGDAGQVDILSELTSDPLEIEQSGTSMTISYADGRQRTVDWSGGQHGAARARWNDDRLVVTYLGSGKQRLKRTFISADEGQSMSVITVFNKLSLMQMYHLDAKATADKYGGKRSEDQGKASFGSGETIVPAAN